MEPATTWPSTRRNSGTSRSSRLLRLMTDSRPESLTDARRQIRQALSAAGVGPGATLEMEIAASEILSNTHRHAYPGTIGPVFVEVFHTAMMVMVIIIDHGIATDAPALPRVQPLTTQYGGRSLYLVG